MSTLQKTVSVTWEGLTEVPSIVFETPELTSLDLSCNSISEVPKELFGLTALRELNLSSNSLVKSIPVGLDKLTKLRKLSLSSNWLSEPIQRLSSLRLLTHLDLSDNLIVDYKAGTFRGLRSIQRIDLGSNLWSKEAVNSIILDIYENRRRFAYEGEKVLLLWGVQHATPDEKIRGLIQELRLNHGWKITYTKEQKPKRHARGA